MYLRQGEGPTSLLQSEGEIDLLQSECAIFVLQSENEFSLLQSVGNCPSCRVLGTGLFRTRRKNFFLAESRKIKSVLQNKRVYFLQSEVANNVLQMKVIGYLLQS
jgi:hypothetical protein